LDGKKSDENPTVKSTTCEDFVERDITPQIRVEETKIGMEK
jgi:hypothetical protein